MSNTHIEDAAQKREKEHAKLFSYKGRQVLAHLYRDADDDLCIVLQLWVALHDEQLRVNISSGGFSDDVVGLIFDRMSEEDIASALEALEIPALVGEAAGG